MKRLTLVLFLVFFTASSTVYALSWAYPFVVWKDNVYEVTEEALGNEDIGNQIGQVKTKPNDMTGDFYGNASNTYPIGTKYYERHINKNCDCCCSVRKAIS
jgi:hypothetical protein